MRTPPLLLFFLLGWCQTAQCLNSKRVNLGQNMSLDCLIDVKDIYWVFQKQTDSPVLILRTFTSESTTPQFYDKRFKDKCSLQTFSRLFIRNITINEIGIYYCAKTGTTLQLSNGTRLYTTGLLMLKFKKPRKSRQQPQNVKPVSLEDLNTAQYSEIELSTYSRGENPIQINSTYTLLQKPKPHPRQS
ncbi:uncharacterized protein LOC107745969 isoform X2 [Sinocyclocheilus rhinocerous]|uniref:uncharacterized protein LOC107745969 isoform X2 n=1 Tax=Sinocyclocheilus rhinocerous TaxID=307959 RepID=UPI0007B7DF43|nr:PREDICTED: uncharacterized protein LOC107745969 isoform X2 [Sinocyclocheilus rhinocerous]